MRRTSAAAGLVATALLASCGGSPTRQPTAGTATYTRKQSPSTTTTASPSSPAAAGVNAAFAHHPLPCPTTSAKVSSVLGGKLVPNPEWTLEEGCGFITDPSEEVKFIAKFRGAEQGVDDSRDGAENAAKVFKGKKDCGVEDFPAAGAGAFLAHCAALASDTGPGLSSALTFSDGQNPVVVIELTWANQPAPSLDTVRAAYRKLLAGG